MPLDRTAPRPHGVSIELIEDQGVSVGVGMQMRVRLKAVGWVEAAELIEGVDRRRSATYGERTPRPLS